MESEVRWAGLNFISAKQVMKPQFVYLSNKNNMGTFLMLLELKLLLIKHLEGLRTTTRSGLCTDCS